MNNEKKLEQLRAEIARIEKLLREINERIANETIGEFEDVCYKYQQIEVDEAAAASMIGSHFDEVIKCNRR